MERGFSDEEVAELERLEQSRKDFSLSNVESPTQQQIDADYQRTGDYEIQAEELGDLSQWNEKQRAPQSDPPLEGLTDEEVAALEIATMQTPSQVPMGSVNDQPLVLTDQQVKELEYLDDFSGRQVADMLAELGPNEVTALGALNIRDAAANYRDRKTGWFDRALYYSTIPEQMMARQAVNLMENFDGFTTDEAKDLLSRDQLHGSDLVHVWWKNQFGMPDSWAAKAGKVAVGFAADILLDPLSYINPFALATKSVQVAGRSVTGKAIRSMSKADRHYVKTLQKLEKVVTKSGSVKGADDAADVAERNRAMIGTAIDSIGTNRMGFEDLLKPMDLTPSALEEANKVVRKGMTQKSLSRELIEGDRIPTIGIKVPFTNYGVEASIPLIGRPMGMATGYLSYGLVEKLGGGVVNTLRTPIKLGASERNLNPIDPMMRYIKDLSSRTGALLFDEQQRIRIGARELTKEQLGRFNKDVKTVLAQKQRHMSEAQFEQLMMDMVDELDNGLHSREGAIRLAQEKGVPVFEGPGRGSGFGDEILSTTSTRPVMDYDEGMGLFSEVRVNPLVERLYTASPQDAARMERLSFHPEIREAIGDMRIKMQDMVDEYKKRGIPMEELNPFGEGWARQYVKHMVTNNFVRKMKEIGKAEDGIIGEAMEELGRSIGGVDGSSLGRKYRGTIREANELSAKEYDGIKLFVEDPVELFSARVHEMDKVVQDYDLFSAAEKYAVVNSNPGVGWVKYNPDDFRKVILDIEKSDPDKWKVFVPDVFKSTKGDVYLPEAVYDKLHFSVNGWNDLGMPVPIATSLHALDRLFRGNALYGMGYLGQNAISNALTYLMHSDVGAVSGLYDAFTLGLPFVSKSRRYKVQDHLGKWVEKNGLEILDEAIEDGVLRTSARRELEFSDVAELVASNRQLKSDDLYLQAKNIADVAFGYRATRALAQYSDELPKLAHYLSRRKAGFTRQGAAEAAEQLYYNFGISSKSQDVVRKAIPFSSFAIKTTESIVEQLRDGKLSRLTIPGKVQAVFDGAFVQDHETRRALDESLPWYKQWGLHPVHGPLLPGQRELLLELPWANATISQLFNPEFNLNPLLQVLGMGLTDKLDTDEFGNLEEGDFWRKAAQQVGNLYLPPPINNALAIAEITGQADLGGFFVDQYKPRIDDRPEQSKQVGGLLFNETMAAADFGKAIAKKYGDDWLYSWFFKNQVPEGQEGSTGEMIEHGVRGEFIRRRFRQFALGTATINKLDVNYMMNRKAIERQVQKLEDARTKKLQGFGLLVESGRKTLQEVDKEAQELDPGLVEAEALRYKLQALDEYYGFVLKAEEEVKNSGEFPGLGTVDVFEVFFGIKDYDYSKGGGVVEEKNLDELTQFDFLTPKKTKKALLRDASRVQDKFRQTSPDDLEDEDEEDEGD